MNSSTKRLPNNACSIKSSFYNYQSVQWVKNILDQQDSENAQRITNCLFEADQNFYFEVRTWGTHIGTMHQACPNLIMEKCFKLHSRVCIKTQVYTIFSHLNVNFTVKFEALFKKKTMGRPTMHYVHYPNTSFIRPMMSFWKGTKVSSAFEDCCTVHPSLKDHL